VTLQSTSLSIGGAGVDYTAQLQNPGIQVTDVFLQGEMEQDQADGTVIKGAGGTYVDCGAGFGILPNTGAGTCAIPWTVTALGDAFGGSFVSGPARFVLRLYSATSEPPVLLDVRTIDVTLVLSSPTIQSITPASTDVVLDSPGAFTDISASIANPGPELTTVIVQGYIVQGSARYAAGGTIVTCGPISGTLPSGPCVQASVIVASNSHAGTGTLVPGSATFELELIHTQGTTQTILDTKTLSINLVSSAASSSGSSPNYR
jgi:hypothetical protein